MAVHMFRAGFMADAAWKLKAKSVASSMDDDSREGILQTEGAAFGRKELVAHVFPGAGGGMNGSANFEVALPLRINSLKGCQVESENFKGQVLFLHRQEVGCDHPYADFFSSVRRQCEFRAQGVFKKAPRELYVVAEIEEPLRLSYTTGALLNALLGVGHAMSSARGAPMTYNFATEQDVEGNAVRHYWAAPLHTVDFVFRTPAGEEPPPITQPFPEMAMNDTIEELKKVEDGDVVTFAFWDQYLNFEKWELCNMPFGLNISWSSILGDRRLHIAFYDWVGPGEGMQAGVHSQANKEYLFSIVMDQRACEPTHRVDIAAAEDLHASATDFVSSCMPMRRWWASVLEQIVCRLCDFHGRGRSCPILLDKGSHQPSEAWPRL